MHILYFYGFASGPMSSKAQFFKNKFSELKLIKPQISFEIIDYIPDKQKFSKLRVSDLIKELHEFLSSFSPNKLVLFGSSFGGLICVWLASQHPKMIEKIILMAPALKFSATTIIDSLEADIVEKKKNKTLKIPHYRYNEDIPL
ncbi:MAG: YqiA/YcfP family alpha/beta fold hydrolase, partial [Candidatus Hodarchaeales archaeon]